jgi:hypothetical protein
MDKPQKKTNYTRFSDIEGANDYARANEKDLSNLFQYVSKCPQVVVSKVVPALSPRNIGDIYINTVTAKVYIATGISSSSDYKILN